MQVINNKLLLDVLGITVSLLVLSSPLQLEKSQYLRPLKTILGRSILGVLMAHPSASCCYVVSV